MTYKKTDWRVIGVSGETADGRTILAKELQEMADQYDPEIYGARINLEHMNFLFPDFAGGYGDVVELKAEPWAKDETKTALLAKLNITESLQKLWDRGQKIYTSMEITPRFADTNKAYLTGLAITDTPASLGTTANYTAAKTKAEEKIFTAYRQTETQEIAMTQPQDSNQAENQAKPLTEEHAESIFSRLFAKYFGKKKRRKQSQKIHRKQPTKLGILKITPNPKTSTPCVRNTVKPRKSSRNWTRKSKPSKPNTTPCAPSLTSSKPKSKPRHIPANAKNTAAANPPRALLGKKTEIHPSP